MNYKNKTILITGGTGTFGKKFVEFFLKNYKFKKLIIFSRDEAKQHEMRLEYKNRTFATDEIIYHNFEELVEFMTSSETHIMKLEKANAVSEWRNLMGATNPAEAEAGTIRAKYGTDISMNATHGSDSNENAEIEINFFF